MAKAEKKKATKKVNFSELSETELSRYHGDFRKELQEIRFSMITSSYTNNARVGILKKDIARILTVQTQRKNKAASPAAVKA